jgi:hypothetical protein
MLRTHLLPLAGYALLSVLLTYPLVAAFRSELVGGPIARADGWQNVWAGWWSLYALRHAQSPFVTPLLYHPQGISLLLQTLNITNWALTLPVQLVLGPLAAYNAAVLLGFALSGYTAYLLVLRVVEHRQAALFAGACFTAAPFHVGKFYDGQLEHVALQWLPLYALALYAATQRLSWRRLALCALALLLVSYTSWYYTIFCAVYTLVDLGWLALAERRPRHAALLGAGLAAAGLVIVAPALWVALNAPPDLRPSAHWVTQARQSASDLSELFLPSALHPIWGAPIQVLQERFHPNNSGWLVTPGYTVPALAVYGAARAWRQARRWALLLVALALLALGGSLKVGGYDTGIPLPYRLLELLPGANLGRRPSHFMALALLPLVVLVGFGLRDCFRRYTARGAGWLVFALALLVAVEYLPRAKERSRLDVPPAYALLAGQDGAVLDVPSNQGGLDGLSMTLKHQLVHNRPIIGGYVSRRPDYWLTSAPGVSRLWRLRCDAELPVVDAQSALASLSFYGVRNIVLNLPALTGPQERCARSTLERWGLAPQPGSDDRTLLYRLPLVEAQPFAYLHDGWYSVEHEAGASWRWMGRRGELVVVNTTGQVATMLLELTLTSYREARSLNVYLGERQVGQLTVQPGPARVYRLPLHSGAGEQMLALEAAAETDPAANRQISVRLSAVRIVAPD